MFFLFPALRGNSQESQEEGVYSNWDIDSLFGPPETGESDDDPDDASYGVSDAVDGGPPGAVQNTPPGGPGGKAADSKSGALAALKASGLSVNTSFSFAGAYAPGWNEAPWFWDDFEPVFNQPGGAIMEGSLSLAFTISKELKVQTSFTFSYPGLAILIGDFYLDYELKERFFLRAGKYIQNWGYSSNFPFTNLPARTPDATTGGDSYAVRLDVPIGIGGLQLLAMTRTGYITRPDRIGYKEIAFGAKYNLAFTWADINLGSYYYVGMPLRFFYSLKTTLNRFFDTEFYTEGLAAVSHQTWKDPVFSFNAGVINTFFNKKLSINAEVYYNGEADAYWFNDKNIYNETEITRLYGGLNLCLNVIYKPGFADLALFLQALYYPSGDSFQLVPGLRFVPFRHVTVNLAVPMALGSRDGVYYYPNGTTIDKYKRPFCVMIGITFDGRLALEL
jgi:hypothetical protein